MFGSWQRLELKLQPCDWKAKVFSSATTLFDVKKLKILDEIPETRIWSPEIFSGS